jgi:integrase
MFTRTRYQDGCLTTEKRKRGPDVRVFSWRGYDAKGNWRQQKRVIGTVKQYRSISAAKKAIAALRAEINRDAEGGSARPLTIEQLAEHYAQKELTGERLAYSTRITYERYLKKWVVPRWGKQTLPSVVPVAVEEWLAGLQLAQGTKSKIRNVMCGLFSHAKRYRFISENPIEDVRQGAKREHIPEVMTPEEIMTLLSELKQQPWLTLVVLVAVTGLRRGELLGLKWSDIDFEKSEISLNRAVVHQVVGGVKTEASKKPVSMEPDLAFLLDDWKSRTDYSNPDDWVFASPEMGGKQPYWPENILRRYIRPAAERAGIQKRIGFHTFRHSLTTIMKANGEDIKTVQEILRHANSRITMDVYAQAVTPAKRQAQKRVLEQILPPALRGSRSKLRIVTKG